MRVQESWARPRQRGQRSSGKSRLTTITIIRWIEHAFLVPAMALPLYAASELLTVPTTAVPEPSTMGPAAVAGLAGLGWAASGAVAARPDALPARGPFSRGGPPPLNFAFGHDSLGLSTCEVAQ